MNTKILIASAVALVLVGGLVGSAFWYAFDSRHESPASSMATTSSAAAPTQASTRQPSPNVSAAVPGTAGTRAPLEGVRSYGDLAARLADNRTDEAQRLQYLLTATQVCEGYRRTQDASSMPARRDSKSMNYYNGYVARFCADFSGNSGQLEEQLIAHTDSDVVQARELPIMAADAPLSREASLVGETIVLTSKNPDAVYSAAGALAGQGGWQLGQNIASTAQERAALQQAQWMAAQMVACDLSGGCGVDGLTTVIECGSYSNCTSGITVREVLRQTSTPVQYDLANKIYEQLIKDRERASSLRS